MGKLLMFPGVNIELPTRAQLVEEASVIIMKEVTVVFVEQLCEHVAQGVWFREIRDYLWRQEIKLTDDRDFRQEDLKRWKAHWRNQALDYISAKRVR